MLTGLTGRGVLSAGLCNKMSFSVPFAIEEEYVEALSRRRHDATAFVVPTGQVDVVLGQEGLPQQLAVFREAEQIVAEAEGANEETSGPRVHVEALHAVLKAQAVAEARRLTLPAGKGPERHGFVELGDLDAWARRARGCLASSDLY